MKKYARRQSKHSRKESHRNSHSVPETIAISRVHESAIHLSDDEEDHEQDEETSSSASHVMRVKVKLWEFGQNDPKKDSGSRLCKLNFAVNYKHFFSSL